MPNRTGCKKANNLQEWGAPPTGHAYQGGDLLGVAEHLDYLADLGINAIYFNPIFQSGSNHRYHTHDYYQVDPMLGGNAALRELLDAAHARNIRVVLDGVFNHASRGFFQFHDILENGAESAYLDWFTVHEWPLRPYGSKHPNYAAWWNNPALPKFNTDTQAVRDFIFDVRAHWVEFGIDGWRLDVPTEIDDDEFWREFRRVVKGANPEAYIVGEIWGDAQRWLMGDQYDAVMNYGISRAALGLFGRETFDREYRPGGFKLVPLGARAFAHEVERLMGMYPWEVVQAQFNLLDSHDTARFHPPGEGRLADPQAVAALPDDHSRRAVPLLRHRDRHDRRARPRLPPRFPLARHGSWKLDLLDFTKRAIRLRRDHPALRRGKYAAVYAHEDILAFARRAEEESALVLFNAGPDVRAVTLDVDEVLPDGTLTDVWGGLQARVSKGTIRHLELPPQSAAVFVHGVMENG